jgi:hypothetical protein
MDEYAPEPGSDEFKRFALQLVLEILTEMNFRTKCEIFGGMHATTLMCKKVFLNITIPKSTRGMLTLPRFVMERSYHCTLTRCGGWCRERQMNDLNLSFKEKRTGRVGLFKNGMMTTKNL